jgi:hypothetical protein
MQIIIAATVGIIAAIAALFVGAFLIVATNPQGAATVFTYIKDVFISVLCLQGILIVAAFGILIAQIARFVNLLRNETKPMTDEARQTLKAVQTSAKFVGESAAEPFVAARSWWAGLRTFLNVLISVQALRALLKKKDTPS